MKTTRHFFFPSLTTFLTSLTLLAALSAHAQVPSYVPTNGLVGYWPFNGNANDESGNGNNGTVLGGVSNTTDRFGATNSAYLFDGVDGRIDVPSLNSFSYTPVTYSAWVIVNSYFPSSFGHKFRSVIGRNTAFVGDNGVIGFYADNNVAGGAYDNTFSMWRGAGTSGDVPYSASIPALDTWINVVYTQASNGDWSWYENGQLTNNGNFIDAQNDFNFFQIGGCNNQSTGNTYWNDKLDDIGIWNRALTADEVLALYNGCDVSPLAVSGNVTPTQFTQETYTYPNTVGSTYNWTVTNGAIVSGQGTNSVDVMWANSGIGSVSVVETNATNCSGDIVTYDVVIIPTDVEELSSSLSLFPNPTTSEINLQTTTELIGSDFIIFDELGKQIHKQQILSTNTRINISAFAAGNYVVKVGGVVKRFEVKK
jgi:hypothetical protein